VASVAAKIIETLSQPVQAADRELTVTPSIGIAVFPEDGRDADMLIRNADAAMYHAKESGRARYQFFTEQMNQAASRRVALEADLRVAVPRGELVVQYQPIQRLADDAVVAHEALMRWQRPQAGLAAPADFLQVAEDTGLILGIGEWVMREACRWGTFIGTEHGVQVAVNLSAREFNDTQLIERVRRVLAESGLPPDLLALEVSEATVMHQPDVSASTLKKLRDTGVSLAIDDFGAGLCSLAALCQLPVDRLKIDRSVVAGAPGTAPLLGGIVSLARALRLEVVAVGVETQAQRELLAELGCDAVQGFLVGRPVGADAASKDYV
jgi:predicted signal transduction protein with EAL and GGDEF domain